MAQKHKGIIKMRTTTIVFILLLVFNISPIKAEMGFPVVIEDTNVILEEIDDSHWSSSFYDSDYSLSAYNTPTEWDWYDTLWFKKTDNPNYTFTLTPTTWTVADEIDCYLVPYGAEFSYKTISSGQFEPLFVLDNPGSITVPYGTFYLGINTGPFDYNPDTGANEVGPDRNVFGWVLFSISSTELIMLDNAMAYESQGIYVGTTNIVPIPAAFYLLGFSIICLIGFKNKFQMKLYL